MDELVLRANEQFEYGESINELDLVGIEYTVAAAMGIMKRDVLAEPDGVIRTPHDIFVVVDGVGGAIPLPNNRSAKLIMFSRSG